MIINFSDHQKSTSASIVLNSIIPPYSKSFFTAKNQQLANCGKLIIKVSPDSGFCDFRDGKSTTMEELS